MNRESVAIEIHRKALENVTTEMAITLVRTSGSPIVTDAMDFSTCLLDVSGEQLGLSAFILAHSASSWLGTKAVIAGLAESGEEPRPGDGWIVNDPYSGGAMHQGDVGIITPMFYGGELAGWGFANMHLLDVGGSGVSGIAPGARTVYEEGVRFPPLRIIHNGRIDEVWERYIGANVRAPAPVLNDIRSMIAANNTAQKKLESIIKSHGTSRHREYCEINKELSERLLRQRIERIPDGRYEAVEFIEYDGHGSDDLLEVRGALEVAGGELRFTFSGDPQVDAFVNGTVAAAHGNVMANMLTTLSFGDLPFNAGMWRPITIDVGEPGTVVNATEPAPVSTSHADGGQRIGKVAKSMLVQALSLSDDPTLRSRVAGLASDGCATAGLFGLDERKRPIVMYYMDPGVGIGGPAQSVMDGQDAYGCTMMAGCGMPDVELHEATDPVLFLWRRVAANSGGPGQFRGGQGIDQAYVIAYTDRVAGFLATICAETPPAGFGGGFPAAGSTQFPIRSSEWEALLRAGVHPTDDNLGGERERTRNKDGAVTFFRSDVLRCINGGGSGLGDPLLRPPELVAQDIRDGYVTRGHAQAAYGVVVSPDGKLLDTETEMARRALREERIGVLPSSQQGQPASVGIAVEIQGTSGTAQWTCGYCGSELCRVDEDWRSRGTVKREEDIGARFERLEMQVYERAEPPDVVVRDYFCPRCAGCLATDVAPRGIRWASPRLAG